MTENEQRPFSSVCEAVRSQADSMLLLADAMALEARKQASSLEAVLSYLDEPADLGEPAPLDDRHHEPRTSIKDTIAFLRDIGGRND